MRQEQGLRGVTRNRQALPRPPRQGGAGSWLSPHCGRERRGLRVCGGSLLLDRGAQAIRESSRQGGVVTVAEQAASAVRRDCPFKISPSSAGRSSTKRSARLAKLVAPQLRVPGVAERVAEEVEAEHGEADGEPRED